MRHPSAFAFVLLLCASTHSIASLPDSTAAGAATESKEAGRDAALVVERSAYPALFAAARTRFGELPQGLLESIAYVQSRWVMLDVAQAPAAESAPAVGIVGLYAGGGFADQVGAAAALLAVPREWIERDARWNILGAAALLSNARKTLPTDVPDSQLPAAYAGYPVDGSRVASAFAREGFAYDVLLALDRGVDDGGIFIAARAIDWERQFPLDALARQRAPFVRLDLQCGSIEADGYVIDAVDETVHATGAAGAPGIASTDYAAAMWVASPYFHARTAAISAVAIHTMQGSYAGTIA